MLTKIFCVLSLGMGLLILPILTPKQSTQSAVAQQTWGWHTCRVTGIRTGQLALRPDPDGKPFAGLNNGNIVEALIGTGKFVRLNGVVWYYVKVVQGPNSQVNGREGWVNSDYLNCD